MSPAESSYALISPVRDEEGTLPSTIASVLAQGVLPARWVFVDDGSSDGTAGILKEAALRHGFIRVVRIEDRGFRQTGPGVVRAFLRGIQELEGVDWKFLGKLDGDVQVPSEYYQKVLEAFAGDPGLGIASGACLVPSGRGFRLEKSIAVHTRGPCKVYRRECLEEIGGIRPTLGWDGLDGYMARQKGWRTRTLPGLMVIHLRPTHGEHGFRGALRDGRGAYCQHYRPSYLLARAALNLFRPPYLLRGIGLLAGYLGAHLRRLERIEDPELIRYIHDEQRRRLRNRGEE
jgi:biofilm PGA synthesis N-glycosyltransferase PgaC